MDGCVLHLWNLGSVWEVRASDETFVLARRGTRDEAIVWCEEHAEDLGATVVYVWDLAAQRRMLV